MSDTIELLEAVGRDASLRHAPPNELAARLERRNASAALVAATVSGDVSRLSRELGPKPMQTPQSSQTGFEEEPDGDEEGGHLPIPDSGKSPLHS